MIKSKKMAMISLIAVFITGLFCGILAERLLLSKYCNVNDRHKRPSLVQIFKKELDLTQDQETQLKSMLEDIKQKHHQAREEQKVIFDSLRVNFDDQFKEILDSNQKEKFSKLQEEWKQKQERDKH